MADTNSTPQKITTVAQFLNELVPESEHQQVIAAFRDPHSSTLHAMIEQYASVKGQPVNITDILEDSKQYIHRTESSPSQETNSKARPWRRWGTDIGVSRGSAAERVAISIQEEASQKLLTDFEKAVGENRIADATNLINSLSAEHFLSTQIGALKARVPSEFHTTIDTRHQKIKNSPKTKDIQELQKHIDMLGSIIHEGMSEKEKQNLISEFQQRLLLQKRATFHDFSEIVTGNKRRFFRKVSIFPRDVEKKLLHAPVEEKTVSKRSLQERTNQGKAPPELTFYEGQSLPEVYTEALPGDVPSLEDRIIPEESFSPNGAPGNTRASLSSATSYLKNGVSLVSRPEFWYGIGIIIFVIFFLLLVVLIFEILNGGFPDTSTVDGFITTIPCGVSLQDAQRDLTTTGSTDSIFTQLIRDRFAISFTDGRAITDTPTDADNTLFQTLCLMYGRDPTHYTLSDDKSVRGYLNTFGQLFLGLPIMTYQSGAESGLGRSGYTSLKYFDVGQTLCDDSYKLSGQAIITLSQPTLCDGVDGGYALRFKVAYNMGIALYDRVFDSPPYSSTIGSHDSVDKSIVDEANALKKRYNDFFATESANLLPTHQCHTASSKDAAKHCFADMLGTYVSYPYYFDDGTRFPYDSTITPPATPPTPQPFPSSLSTFSNSSNAYYAWYQFAHDNIFDGVDFFQLNNLSSQPGQTVPYALKLTKDLQTICANKQNSGYVYGHYFVAITLNNIDCLNNSSLTSQYPTSVINTLVDSTKNFQTLQCIGFAQAISNGVDGIDKSIQQCLIYLPGWDSVDKFGKPLKTSIVCPQSSPYTFIPKAPDQGFKLLPGDYALWRFSDWGHIAVVTDAKQSTSTGTTYSYTVAEANGGNGYVDISTTYQIDNNLIGVLRHN